jgi:hypothetical protein
VEGGRRGREIERKAERERKESNYGKRKIEY